MTQAQSTKRVAILVADGFEQVELEVPARALKDAGFITEIIAPGTQMSVLGYHHADKGDAFSVDVPLLRANAEHYDALLLPGGVHNPDTLRQDARAVQFVRNIFEMGKPIAAICHGPWTLIDAAAVAGRKMTSWPSLKSDLTNAGAQWVDESVVVDRGLVTSRKPADLPDFCKAMLAEFQNAEHRPAQELACLAKLRDLIKDIGVAMMTTVTTDGTLHSRPMVTMFDKTDQLLWFFTGLDSLKSHEVAEDAAINLSYSDPRSNRYVSVSGHARVVRDRKKAEALWTPICKAFFPKGLDDPELALMQVKIESAELWDAPSGKAVALYGLAKSLFTGRPYEGESARHERIELETKQSTTAMRGVPN